MRAKVPVRRDKQMYEPGKIEKKWQKEWRTGKTFSPDLEKSKKPYYNLMMFPYPSAEGLHVGNMYAFTGSDIWGRFMRMQGYDVFEPIGLDGFGIHSENYAIKIGKHPAKLAKVTQKRFYSQLEAIGNAYDWTRTLETYDPDYYRWTQWIFVQMFKKGLAYRKNAQVNWCPSCKTVLADEQVINGKCERCKSVIENRSLEQWFFKITDYAERLLSGLTHIDWTEKVKIAQRNWIGRSEGGVISFKLASRHPQESIDVFTTRPDTLFGATFLVISPESPLVEQLVTKERMQNVSKYIKEPQKSKVKSQNLEREKTGVFTGSYAINPATGEQIPIWVADYVLGGYGSGAIMAVPAHDQRDFEFAKKYDLAIKQVIKPRKGAWAGKSAYEGEGVIVNSDGWDSWEWPGCKEKILSYIEKKGWGKRQTAYHLRDWLISRQRYWGPPIPMIYCEKCASGGRGERKEMPGWYAVPEKDLPVKLPYIENYRPTGIRSTGSGQAVSSPLAQDPSFVRVNCSKCGSLARRETDVSDTFLDSAWYYLRYPSVGNNKVAWDSKVTKKWLPVNMYIGGAEHSVLHLLYVRFLTMVFHDLGLVSFEEPFPRFYAHGLLIKEGAKMSKSKGNVVVPDDYIKQYGADTLRAYLMFLGPFDQGGDFRDTGVGGMHRFLSRVWDLVVNWNDVVLVTAAESRALLTQIHKTIKRVTEDMEGLRYNRAIAGLMEYVNALRAQVQKSKVKSQGSLHRTKVRCAEWDGALRTLVLLLAPFAPHVAEELWERLASKGNEARIVKSKTANVTASRNEPRNRDRFTISSVHLQPWPKFAPELAQEQVVEIPVQVNGKLRGTVQIDAGGADQQRVVEKEARAVDGVHRYLEGKKIGKVIFVPGRLINFVTS